MPSGITSYELYPSLPTALDPFVMRPADASHGLGTPAVTLVDFSEAADYDGARALPEWALTLPGIAATFGDIEGARAGGRVKPRQPTPPTTASTL